MKQQETARNYLIEIERERSKQRKDTLKEICINSAKKLLRITGLFGLVKRISYSLGFRPKNKLSADSAARWFAKDEIHGVYFYQSFPMLNIGGVRHTDIRIQAYKIYDFITESMNVLDIGCNVGFFDMTIADRVKSITGIEYDESCVKIANDTAGLLGLDNVKFLQADFNEWVKNNSEQYDLVLSFAVHHWLNAEPDSYALCISELLSPGGCLLFESHNLAGIGLEDEAFFSAFLNHGFTLCDEGTVKDDGNLLRKWALFRK